jgi:deoxyadenosine/deoxycytidine kinase
MSRSTPYIAIAGNIGSGKSSLTTLLSQHLKWKAFFEIVETNPYLQDFYGDMKRWSFHTQIYFLTKRFQHLQEILRLDEPVIQDRSIFEDAEIFARNLYLTGQMEERDYRTYLDHFQIMSPFLRAPDLLIYLRSDVDSLMTRIQARSRPMEMSMDRAYVSRLNLLYDQWVESYQRGPVVTIDVSGKDFVNRQEDLQKVLSVVRWEVERILNPAQAQLPLNWLPKPSGDLGSLAFSPKSIDLPQDYRFS